MHLLLGILVLLVPAAAGFVATYVYDNESTLGVRLAIGVVIGQTILSLLIFVFASIYGLSGLTISIALLAAVLRLLVLRHTAVRDQISSDWQALISGKSQQDTMPTGQWNPLYWILGAVCLVAFFSRALYFQPDGMYTGDASNIGDLPFHMGIVSGFASGNNFPPQHPEIAGARLTYHFMADLYAAVLVHCGISAQTAFLLQNSMLALALFCLLVRFGFLLTKDNFSALLSPAIFFLSGGLGFEILAANARDTDKGFLQLIWRPIQTYTISVPQQPDIQFGNMLTTELMTQRPLLLGLPLLLAAAILLHPIIDNGLNGKEIGNRLKFAAIGLIAGILPLAHIFCYGVVMALSLIALFCCVKQKGAALNFALLFAIALALSVPQILWLVHPGTAADIATPHFRPSLYPGWVNEKDNIIIFWLRNTGPFIPLLICALALTDIRQCLSKATLIFTAFFCALFVVANLFQLAPWIWDNSKVFVIWLIGTAPVAALALTMSARLGSKPWGQITGVALCIALMLSGVLDAWRVTRGADPHCVLDRSNLTMAENIARIVPVGQPVLTAPSCFTGAIVSGRTLVEGYPGHLWSQGYDYQQRDNNVHAIYSGSPNAQDLLRRYGVRYVEVGSLERSTISVNQAYFDRYTIVATSGDQRLYDMQTPISK